MQVYLVGGAVRDALLGLPMQDRDWVVVGATPEVLLAQGYRSVGKDFPVFLHPQTHEEYALARTERKTAPGYRGFAVHAAPEVTLEEDLARRDLTINAIAVPQRSINADGSLDIRTADFVDPFDGRSDLERKVLRHVTAAFCEDPVRILRLARLAARFADFSVAEPTLKLMREMVLAGEVKQLVPERVWQELAKGLMENTPSRMFEVLRGCGALADLLPQVKLESDPDFRVLDRCARRHASLPVRVACLVLAMGDGEREVGLFEQLRLPADCRELAELALREHGRIDRSGALAALELLQLLERCDAVRRPQRFEELLLACECTAWVHPGPRRSSCAPRARLLTALAAARGVDTHPVAEAALATGASGEEIGQLIQRARLEAIRRAL